MFENRISIFTGHFGSGKTEVAVNYALKMSQMYPKTAIVDFDIVNPFFRTADAREKLESSNIKVILPMYANTNVDVPALPPEINTLFEKKDFKVVFDVGGDDLGARVLSRYKDDISADDFAMLFVINTRRGMTDTPEKIEEMIYNIEKSSRLKVTGLINNTNLLHNTQAEDIIIGREIIQRVSDKLDIPIAFTSAFEGIAESLEDGTGTEILKLQKLIKLPWD